jgi:apolipoprotein D and lipocalin family protein
VNLKRYMGSWNEVARYDQPYEKGDVEARAEYELNGESSFSVVNLAYVYEEDKVAKIVTAKADGRVVFNGDVTAEQVRFYLDMGMFGHLPYTPYADYWIVMLDDVTPPAEPYQWAVVSGPSRNSLWVLVRDGYSFDAETAARIAQRLHEWKFTDRAITYPQHRQRVNGDKLREAIAAVMSQPTEASERSSTESASDVTVERCTVS